ncbi:hypothetical protein MVEN_02579700 [Mycena venus]|uniref:Uncharacterized protein n=1 Tax=Mycena venus TaxID=2733690 RepID=A0A8H6TZA5_9AGAR|nr:hypothetical protein MVEN_02579700 [Mycena venus]
MKTLDLFETHGNEGHWNTLKVHTSEARVLKIPIVLEANGRLRFTRETSHNIGCVDMPSYTALEACNARTSGNSRNIALMCSHAWNAAVILLYLGMDLHCSNPSKYFFLDLQAAYMLIYEALLAFLKEACDAQAPNQRKSGMSEKIVGASDQT